MNARTPPDTAAPAPPLWQTLAAQILAEMSAGRLADGARLPPEREMAAAFGVATGTLRRALADLAARGLLERRQGSGNYVRHAGLGREVYGLFRLERADGAPGAPGADVLEVREAPAPDWAPFARATRIRRLRRLGGTPAAAEEIFVDRACGALAAEDLGPGLYLTYATRLRVHVASVEDRVGLAAMPAWAPAPLAPGAGAGHVLRRTVAHGGATVEVSATWFDPAVAAYVNRATRTAPLKEET